jgi:hypothetical protein
MTDTQLQRFSGAALIAGGLASALFWVLAAKLGTFAGDAVVRDPLWVPSQLLHVFGALLVLVGLPALFAVHRHHAGALGLVGGVLAFVGTALFAADGIIALSVFPTLAKAGPEILSPTGAMNSGPMLATFIAISAINLIGWVLFAAGLLRARALPRLTVSLLMLGGILFNLPPGPVSIVVLAAGGVLWGFALAHLGSILRRERI